MICTGCNNIVSKTTTGWRYKGIWIVGEDESLCDECLQARVGCSGADILYKLNEEKEKELSDETRSVNK